jgi:proteasome lid subunit RPN8/RPN11
VGAILDFERILLSQSQMKTLYNHAEEALPHESVALLIGTYSEKQVIVSRVECLDNVSERRMTSFAVNPELQYKILIEADERGEEMIGIFHSHPAPPAPSSHDRENMRLNQVVWLIASKMTGEWESRAYLYSNGEINEVRSEISDV